MDWGKATNEQLWTIISEDWHVPQKHIEGIVTEGLKRNLFDYLIKHLINKMFGRWSNERRYNFDDLYQIGYIGVVEAMKHYQAGKGSFKTWSYLKIKTEFGHHLNKLNSEKRKVYDSICSLNVQRHDENEETFLDSLIDVRLDPEMVIVKKLFWEEQFEKVTDLEEQILLMFAEGYSMNEIAKELNYKGAAFISRLYHRGIAKINPAYEKMNVKKSGLMTITKGA